MTDTGEWTTRRYLSLLGSIAIWVIVAIDAWFLWPAQLGGSTSMVIVSGISMEPTYFDGDLVIARKVEPTVGDVIVYAPEGLGGAQIVHRIIGGNATDGWELQGDNNDFVDPFTPKGDEVKGVVLVHYSNFGRVTVLLLNPIVWSFVLLAAIVLMVWYGGDTCEDDPSDDDEDDDASAAGDPPGDSSDAIHDDVVDDPVTEDDPAREEVAVGAIASPHEGGLASRGKARVVAAIGAVVLALGLSVTPASASQLSVNTAGGLAAMKYQRCSTQTLAATVAGTATGSIYPQIAVSGVAGSCATLPMVVSIYLTNGSVVTAAGPSVTGTTTLPASYNASMVSRVVVSIDGWLFFPGWTPPVTTPAATCQAVNSAGNVIGGHSCQVQVNPLSVLAYGPYPTVVAYGFGYAVTLSHPNDYFRVTFNFASTPTFPGWSPARVYSNQQPVSGSCTGAVFTGNSNQAWGSGSTSSGYMYVYKAGVAGSPGGNATLLCSQ